MRYGRFILFKAIIAHELLIDGCLELLFDGELNDDFLNRERRYRIFISKKFVDGQTVPAESSSLSKMRIIPGRREPEFEFSYYVSKIEIQLEVFEEEIDSIRKYGPAKTSIIFQSVLLSFSRYYNEAMKGNDFFKPSVNGYGPQIFSLWDNSENISAHIAGAFSLTRNYREKICGDLIPKDFRHVPWRYYQYKAIDCYDIGEYLDAIVWCAVSIETFIMDKIREKGLISIANNTNSSFFKEVALLKKNKLISSTKEKLARKTFSKMNDYRNEIIHGDIDSTFYSRERAQECIYALKSFYEKWFYSS